MRSMASSTSRCSRAGAARVALSAFSDPNTALSKYKTDQGRLFVFKLGGKQEVAALEPEGTPPAEPPPQTADAATIAKGFTLYHRNCLVCHGFYRAVGRRGSRSASHRQGGVRPVRRHRARRHLGRQRHGVVQGRAVQGRRGRDQSLYPRPVACRLGPGASEDVEIEKSCRMAGQLVRNLPIMSDPAHHEHRQTTAPQGEASPRLS